MPDYNKSVFVAHTEDEGNVFVGIGVAPEAVREAAKNAGLEITTPDRVRTYYPGGKALASADLPETVNAKGVMLAMNENGTGYVVGTLNAILASENEPLGAVLGEPDDDGNRPVERVEAEYTIIEREPWGVYKQGGRPTPSDEEIEKAKSEKAGGDGGTVKPKVKSVTSKSPKTAATIDGGVQMLGDCVVLVKPNGSLGYKQGHDSKVRSAIHCFYDEREYGGLGRVPTAVDFHASVEVEKEGGTKETIDPLFALSGAHDDGLPNVGKARHEASEEVKKRAAKKAEAAKAPKAPKKEEG